MKLKFSDVLFKGGFEYNPVLIQCVGLCPVIIASTSLTDSLLMSALIIADLAVSAFTASALLKKVKRYIRVAIYLIIGLLIAVPVLWFIENKTLINMSLGMRIYLPIAAVNSVTAVHCEQFAVKNNVRTSVFDALAAGIGVAFVLIFCGAIREFLGSGTIAGYELNTVFRLSGMLMPYGCLVILGFMAALLKKVFSYEERHHKHSGSQEHPEEIDIGIGEGGEPDMIDMDFSFQEDDDEYAYLLSSVNELIDSFSKNDDGKEDGE